MDSRVQTILAGSPSDGSASIPTGLLQTVNGGRPFVPLAHYIDADDGGNDFPIQLNSTDDLICVSWIQECDMGLDSAAAFITAVGTQGNITQNLYAADVDMKPTGSPTSLGTLDSGASADVWINDSWTSQQLQRGKAYSLVYGVEAGVDVSFSVCRPTIAQGSAFPDSAKTFISTDGGSTWTEATQDTYQKALLNVILNPEIAEAGNPVPKLFFGSCHHANIHIPGSTDLVSIPQAGVSLACSGLTAGTIYYVYAADSSGLTLEASTTVPIYSSGLLVKTGETTKRLVAIICPNNVISTYQGPCDVEDRRNVLSIDNLVGKALGKPNPYAGNTYNANPTAAWMSWNTGSDDWKVEFLSSGATYIEVRCSLTVYSLNTAKLNCGIGLDSKTVIHPRCGHDELSNADTSAGIYSPLGAGLPRLRVAPGAHALYPMQYKQTGGTGNFYYFVVGTPPDSALFHGKIWC